MYPVAFLPRVSVLVLLGALLALDAAAQPLDEPHRYYPLDVGNVWQYSYRDLALFPDSAVVTVRVAGDTTMPNGKRYAIVEEARDNRVRTFYQRVDTAAALIYAYERGREAPTFWLAVSETAHPALSRSQRFDTVSAQMVLGTVRSVATGFNVEAVAGEFGYAFARDVGLVRERLFGGETFWYQERRLRYARVGGQEFGIPVAVSLPPTRPTLLSDVTAYPNPFRDHTTFVLTLPHATVVKLTIFDVLGRKVAVLADGPFAAGPHHIRWGADELSGGSYFAVLETGSGQQVLGVARVP